jgi:trimethylamine--corrinoid protein Co-methyltransferase
MISTHRPKLELLAGDFVGKIIDEAMIVLERQGIFVENAEAIALFREAGMRVSEADERVFITPDLVHTSLKSTPPVVKMYDRSGEKEYVVGGDEVHFDPGSAAVKVLDHSTRLVRKPETQDLVEFARLTEELPHIHFQSTGIISDDVPEILKDSYRLYIGLQFCGKPVVTGTFRTQGFGPMSEMLVAVRGSAAELAKKPLAIFDACPSPPLKWSNLTAQSLVDAARMGIPSELISMGLTGSTSPITIAGTLVQHVAENLAGLVICQLAKKGAPVIFGGSPASFDMRKGTTPMGAIETMMIDAAYTQIAKRLNLPSHAYMGLSDAKLNDSQAGLETGIGAVLAALAGVNVVSGPGMLDFESTISLEKLVIDHEICGMAYRLIEGIAQRDEPIATEILAGLSADAHFLSSPHTKKWYRREHIFPSLIDRDTYDAWAGLGRKSMDVRAKEEVERILRDNPPRLAPDDVRGELERIMRADAAKNGISGLPKIAP